MPDITMCSGRRDGENCPKAETCHRHTAKPTPGRQSWFQVAPFRQEFCRVECDYYWRTCSPATAERVGGSDG